MKNITEKARNKNEPCTSVQETVGTCAERPENWRKIRALPDNILEILNNLYLYDPAQGRLIHRRGFTTRGKIASYGAGRQYRCVCFGGKEMREHRAIWMIVNNALIPDDHEIDHINGDPSDNHIENLRPVTRGQNQWNAKKRKDNTSGLKGVTEYRGKRGVSYSANISINGKVKYLGAFPTAQEAAEAYQKKALELRGEYVPNGEAA